MCVIAHAESGDGPRVCVLKLLGPVTPVLDALVTPRGYTVAAQVAPRRIGCGSEAHGPCEWGTHVRLTLPWS